MSDLLPRPVLLIDDSDSDAMLLQLAFAEVAPQVELHVARDGREAMDLVSCLARGEGPLPQVILLDLNLPGIGGLDLLQQLRGHPVTAGIPVVVYSGGYSDRVREQCLGLGADLRYRKPDTFRDLLAFVEVLLGGPAVEARPA